MPRASRSHQAIVDVAFSPRVQAPLSIETMALAHLKTLAPPAHFLRHERMGFHLLVLYTAGQSRHEVDFEPLAVAAGTLVHVRPNQVHRWWMNDGLQAQLLLVGPDFLPHVPLAAGTPAFRPVPGTLRRLQALFSLVAEETRPSPADAHAAPVLQHALMSVLHALQRDAEGLEARGPADDDRPSRLVAQFREAIERQFLQRLPVAGYAERLACTERTLARACQARCGRSPKAMIDERVLLEARRLLAHTDLPASQVGLALGFSEPTNFHKFFQRLGGELPTAFRARMAWRR